ncbi:MAG: hypothetical protein AAFY21_20310, partial [Cyanobacteria bacterium J06641_2]
PVIQHHRDRPLAKIFCGMRSISVMLYNRGNWLWRLEALRNGFFNAPVTNRFLLITYFIIL